MHCNIIIVFVIAAATARHLPGDDAPYSRPAPTDFPIRTPHRPSLQSHGTGIIRSQGNGDAIQEKPNFEEHGHHRNYENNRRNLEDVPRYSDHFESSNDRSVIKGPIFRNEPKYFDDFGPQNVNTAIKSIPEDKQNHDRSSDDFCENDDQRNNKDTRHRFENEGDSTRNREQNSDKENTDDLNNRFNQAPKTNLNSTRSNNVPRTNEVTPTSFEGRTIENEIKGDARARNASEDTEEKWVWSTTVAPSTGTDLDNRAAFDGGVCPTGKVRIKGTDMCVEKDEDK